MTISIWAIRSADGSIDIISGVIDNSSLNYDTSRIAAGVVTGIGFLGGGVIIRDRFSVRGLATAASLLICAAVGLACGSGFILEAAMSTGVVLLILHFWGKILEILDSRRPAFIAEASCDTPLLQMIREFSLQHGISLKHADVVEINEEKVVVKASFDFPTQTLQLEYFCHHLLLHENVRSAHVVIKSNGHVRDLE